MLAINVDLTSWLAHNSTYASLCLSPSASRWLTRKKRRPRLYNNNNDISESERSKVVFRVSIPRASIRAFPIYFIQRFSLWNRGLIAFLRNKSFINNVFDVYWPLKTKETIRFFNKALIISRAMSFLHSVYIDLNKLPNRRVVTIGSYPTSILLSISVTRYRKLCAREIISCPFVVVAF